MTAPMDWIRVTVFRQDANESAHLSLRRTRAGRVDLRDVRRFLGDLWKVPPRYTSFGIRRLNPIDVGWPPGVLYEGEPPEENVRLGPAILVDVRAMLLDRQDPDFADEW